MKKIKLIIGIIILTLFFSIPTLIAQPGNPPDDGTAGDTPIGGDAPVGSGIAIIVGFTAAYAGKKIYDARIKAEELD